MVEQYRVHRPLERGPDVRVYLVSNRQCSGGSEVLTLLAPKGFERSHPRSIEKLFTFRRCLEHPFLIRVNDLAFRGKRIGLVSEFLKAPNLISVLNSGWSWENRVFLALQLAELLSYLHRKQFVCGYLKPSQLFVRGERDLLANFLLPGRQLDCETRDGDWVRYVAPEFLSGRVGDVWGDLYSLGMVLYQIFTGYSPYIEQNFEALKRKQLVAAPARPRRLNPDIPAEIEQLIRDLIQKDPLLRPTSVEYVIAVLKDSCNFGTNVSPRFCSVLVGRDRELETFRRMYKRQMDSSSTRFLALAGASGIGKTRLMEHFEIIARVSGAVTYDVNHHRGAGILEGFIQSSEQWNHQSDAVAQETKFRNKARSRSLKPTAWAGSFVSHLKRVSESQTVVLFINDLQWMDEGSFEIYRRIASEKDLSLLIVGNYRTDEVQGHWEELKSILSHNELLTEFHLENLTRAEVNELATNILGDVPTKQLDRAVLSECAGNPFYVYESLRCLKEVGELSFNSGCWGWEPTIDASRIPATVVEGILMRFRRLDQLDMEILEYLSVLERPIRVDSLGLMEGIGICGLDEKLKHLERLDFVALSGGLSQPFVSLSHDWLGRVIRETLNKNRLQIIHKCVVKVLEELYIAKNDPMLGATLVHHFLQAGDAVKTRKYIGDVVRWLGQAHFYKEATYLLRRAFKARVIRESNWSWFKRAVELFYLSGRLDECAKLCQQFLSRSPRASHARKAFVYSLLARIYLTNGRLGEALGLLEKVLPIVEELRDEELCVQVEGDLLCCLSRLGNLTRADTVANSVLKRTSEAQNKGSREKLYHALCVYYELSGNRSEASRWETRAIRAALSQDKLVRSAGRINNLGILKLEMGEWEVGEKLCYSTLKFAEQIENRELALYAKGMLCLCQRKRGSHQEALDVLKELVQLNRSLNHNYHVEAELYIELAKNSNYQLFPERALAYLQESQKILDQHPVHASVVDATLVLGWTYVLLANPVLAMRSVSKLKPERIPREKGRLFLLLAQTELDVGNLKEAWYNARQAYDSFADYMLYYRVRTLLIEGEILLMRGLVERANQRINEGLSIAKSEFYLPLMVRSWTLRGRCLLVSNNLPMARSCCLRALQVARQVGRPGLRVEASAVLGKIEAQLGNRDRATQRFTEALQILKERRLHLSPANRQSFTERFIEPIEAERDQFSSNLFDPVPRYFTQLRRFANLIGAKNDQIQTGKEILKIIKQSLPGTSGNFLIRDSSSGAFRTVAVLGRCSKGGKHLLPGSWGDGQVFFPDPAVSGSKPCSIGIPLCSQDQVCGLIYLERQRGSFSEGEIDFLSCLASIAEVQVNCGIEKGKEPDSESGLVVKGVLTIVGEHPEMLRMFGEMRRVAAGDSTVLLFGESGTGKELVAKAVHYISSRRQQRFVPINCSALPESLIESELFGHTQGSFTGAFNDRKGLFECASGGTLFLDEVATMPTNLQTRLLRVLEDRRVRRIGDNRERLTDVRIVAATNQPLMDLVRKQAFREDLYHRLNVCQITIPPLRKRLSDLPLLANHILTRLNKGKVKRKGITPKALSRLSHYSFPGNVRELKNILESAYQLSEGYQIDGDDVSSRLDRGSRLVRHETSLAETVVEDLAGQRADFWQSVRDPFLGRDLSREQVREIVSIGLRVCNGNYRQVVDYFNLPSCDYKKFLSFLSNHNCKVDFRPFRENQGR